MKGFAIVGLLGLLAVTQSSGAARAVSALGHDQVEPGAPGGARPVDTPVGTTADGDQGIGGGYMGPLEAIAEKGAVGLLAVVLFFYRRDFLAKQERDRAEQDERLRQVKEDRERLEDLIEKSNTCITNSTVATARQTDATHRLARSVDNIERRQNGLPPIGGGAGV